MHRKSKLIFFIVMLMFIVGMSTMSFASDSNFSLTSFDVEGGKATEVTENAMGTAIQVIRIVGTGVAIIMLSYIGIKYMMAAPNEKAEFKKSMAIYVVGAVLVFAATNILSVISNFASNIVTS